MKAARAVDEVDQALIVKTDIIALDAVGAGRHIGHERGDFARRVRICDVDDPESMGKPGDWDFRTADIFAELMQSRIVLAKRPILFGYLETGEGNGRDSSVISTIQRKDGAAGPSRTTSSSATNMIRRPRTGNGTGSAV